MRHVSETEAKMVTGGQEYKIGDKIVIGGCTDVYLGEDCDTGRWRRFFEDDKGNPQTTIDHW